MADISKSSGRRVGLIRSKLGLTQIEMCKPLNISQPALLKIEKGNGFNISLLIKLKLKFNVNIDWVLFGIGDMFNKKDDIKSLMKSMYDQHESLLKQKKEIDEKMKSLSEFNKHLK